MADVTDDPPPPVSDRVDDHPHPREAPALFGQERAEAAFLDAWQGDRLHHAWLLRGPKGIGKATLAYRIARALIATPAASGLFGAEPKSFAVPAGCPVRARIVAGSEPRLFVLRREAVATTDNKWRMQTQIAVDNVRRMRAFLQLSIPDGGWRVVLVDPAEEMTPSAANALLKYLEEPPPEVLFLLLSHQPGALLPTIRSRCRTLDLQPLAPDALAAALGAAGAEVAPGDAPALAALAAGSAGQALGLLAHDGLALYARLTGMLDGGRVDRRAMLDLADLCSGREAAVRYALALDLIKTLLARLARAAATGTAEPLGDPEARLIRAAASAPAQAALWAETLARIQARTAHAVAVNLDPGQSVIDTLLDIDETLGRARSLPA